MTVEVNSVSMMFFFPRVDVHPSHANVRVFSFDFSSNNDSRVSCGKEHTFTTRPNSLKKGGI